MCGGTDGSIVGVPLQLLDLVATRAAHLVHSVTELGAAGALTELRVAGATDQAATVPDSAGVESLLLDVARASVFKDNATVVAATDSGEDAHRLVPTFDVHG